MKQTALWARMLRLTTILALTVARSLSDLSPSEPTKSVWRVF